MPKNKGLDRAGILGQEGELTQDPIPERSRGAARPKGSMRDRLDWRDQQKQRGIGREPSLEDKKKIQPTHQVD